MRIRGRLKPPSYITKRGVVWYARPRGEVGLGSLPNALQNINPMSQIAIGKAARMFNPGDRPLRRQRSFFAGAATAVTASICGCMCKLHNFSPQTRPKFVHFIFPKPIDFCGGLWYNIIVVKGRETKTSTNRGVGKVIQ